jgi:hypothetical protein
MKNRQVSITTAERCMRCLVSVERLHFSQAYLVVACVLPLVPGYIYCMWLGAENSGPINYAIAPQYFFRDSQRAFRRQK